MRTLLKVTVDTTTGNKVALDGTLPQIVGSLVEMIKPEASYFVPSNGKRAAYFFFDMQNSSQLAQIAELCFTKLGADVEFSPAMNQDDLKQGLQAFMGSHKK